MAFSFIPEYFIESVDPPVVRVLPWWMCPPREQPEPCPVRPTTFVTLENYDPNFKFPLASSRQPSKIKTPFECVSCHPVLLDEPDPVDPPDPEDCMTVTFGGGGGNNEYFYEDEIINQPDWLDTNQTLTLDLSIGSAVYEYYTGARNTWEFVSGDSLSEPDINTGFVTQGDNSVCLTWIINPGK